MYYLAAISIGGQSASIRERESALACFGMILCLKAPHECEVEIYLEMGLVWGGMKVMGKAFCVSMIHLLEGLRFRVSA